jgi:SAM-dependent MidA family methyltransferase
MNALAKRIANLIAAQGPITVAQYMTIALHERDFGYYATRNPIGAEGDFVTAPEISQMFGELLGLWCVQTWHDQGRPSRARLMELGPGRGTLMADALRSAKISPGFLASIEVTLVESNPRLREIQKATLKDAPMALAWSDSCDNALFDRPTFLLANEFFDAMPIRQLVRTEKGWGERMVGLDTSGELAFVLSPVPSSLAVPADRSQAPKGGVYEFSDTATALAQDISHGIATRGGAALIIDYGYGEPGFGETLQAVAVQKPTALLGAPGEVDISASVDFAALTAAAKTQAASTYGPIGQREFLVDLGILERADTLKRGRVPEHAQSVDFDLNRLIAPDEMGELFKVMAIMPSNAVPPAGF